ncbi:hypothetical protein L1987_08857 [Smallanthus sonchifolius]|uniref:Uncharacterized protein n=1 Tax=Smallanthus sonchifolius TaxID=185202 RepID=A0ACB9JMX1_9ASTR|nr:hypothetical protein L1987_08857 [Smallanthus sonchifolius]
MPRKKDPPSPALPSRRSTRTKNRSYTGGEGNDLEVPTGSVVGLGLTQEIASRVFEPVVMENDSDRVTDLRRNLVSARAMMEEKQDLMIKTDTCIVNKEQSSIPGSITSSECSSESIRILGSKADQKGDFFDSGVMPSAGSILAGNSCSAGIWDSTGNPGFIDAGVSKDEGSLPLPAPLFSTSFKAKVMESMGRVSAGKPGFAENTGLAGNAGLAGLVSLSHAPPRCTRVVDFSVAADDKDGPRDGDTGSRESGHGSGSGLRPTLDGLHEPDGDPFVAGDHVDPMHAIGSNPEPGIDANYDPMQQGYMSEPIPLNVMNSASSSKPDGDHSSSRQYPFVGNEDIHKLTPQPMVVEPIAPRVVEPVCVDPQNARNRGKGIMEDGFIKVTKKNNGPKPRVQIPSLHGSKPDPSKPLGRVRPNVTQTRVTVSNPFEALDDVNQIEDGFPELDATLKKFSMRYVKENTIPDPDVFNTWSKDLKEYYYSLIKDDGEEVESETDGTAKLMSTGVP